MTGIVSKLLAGALIGLGSLDYWKTPYRSISDMQIFPVQIAPNTIIGIVLMFIVVAAKRLKFRD